MLTVGNYDAVMTYTARRRRYVYQVKTATNPATVTVVSDRGGTATKSVTVQ